MNEPRASLASLIGQEHFRNGRLQALGRRMLGEAVRDCHASEATAWVLLENGQYLQAVLNLGAASDQIEGIRVPIEGSIIGMVASTGVAACCGHDAPYNRSVDERTHIRTLAMVAAPVLVEGEVYGVLSAINPTHAEAFTGEDLKTLEFKAYLLGLIIADAARQA